MYLFSFFDLCIFNTIQPFSQWLSGIKFRSEKCFGNRWKSYKIYRSSWQTTNWNTSVKLYSSHSLTLRCEDVRQLTIWILHIFHILLSHYQLYLFLTVTWWKFTADVTHRNYLMKEIFTQSKSPFNTLINKIYLPSLPEIL